MVLGLGAGEDRILSTSMGEPAVDRLDLDIGDGVRPEGLVVGDGPLRARIRTVEDLVQIHGTTHIFEPGGKRIESTTASLREG